MGFLPETLYPGPAASVHPTRPIHSTLPTPTLTRTFRIGFPPDRLPYLFSPCANIENARSAYRPAAVQSSASFSPGLQLRKLRQLLLCHHLLPAAARSSAITSPGVNSRNSPGGKSNRSAHTQSAGSFPHGGRSPQTSSAVPVPTSVSVTSYHGLPPAAPSCTCAVAVIRSAVPPHLVQPSPVDHDPAPYLLRSRFGRVPAHLHQIRLLHPRRRLRQPVRQLAVVGHQQQAFGEMILPPHRVQPPPRHAGPPFASRSGPSPSSASAVVQRRHHPARLVKPVVRRASGPFSSCHPRMSSRPGIMLRPQLGDGRTIHLHPAGQDDLLRLARVGNPRRRQISSAAAPACRPPPAYPPSPSSSLPHPSVRGIVIAGDFPLLIVSPIRLHRYSGFVGAAR